MPLQGTVIGLAGGHEGSMARGKRILVHDFAGHPFQVDLSRHLARQGNDVLHVHCATYTSGKGAVDAAAAADSDAAGGGSLRVVGLAAGREFARYSPARRVAQEVAYGRRFTRVAAGFRPDVVVSCNVPLLAHAVAARWCARRRVPWVFWLQDLYSVAAGAAARDRAGPVGRLFGHGFEAIERKLLRRAAHVVPITDDFLPQLREWGVDTTRRCSVVENWAPLDDLPRRPRANGWRDEQRLGDRFVFLYSGTLGLKHRPELLHALARQHVDDADVVVVSEGMGAARLRQLQARHALPNLRLLPFQPFERYPEVLGAADVVVTLLEPTAGTYSVPSKVLSYLCAARPVLGAIPHENLAARTIERAGAGLVVDPTDEEAFLVAGKRLRNEPQLRTTCGRAARAYAEATFDSEAITRRFVEILDAATGGRASPTPTAALA
jgi:putative colanic acid biosynthesis glycosyltransferase WcaI